MKWSAETDLPFSTRETVALLIPIPLANSARLSSEATLTARRSRPKSRQLIPQVALLLGIRTGRSKTCAVERKAAVSNDPPQLGQGSGDRATVAAPNARSARCTSGGGPHPGSCAASLSGIRDRALSEVLGALEPVVERPAHEMHGHAAVGHPSAGNGQ